MAFRKIITMISVLIGAVLLLTACGDSSRYKQISGSHTKKDGTITVSLGNYLEKGPKKQIWYQTKGVGKNAKVEYIFVKDKGKITTYNLDGIQYYTPNSATKFSGSNGGTISLKEDAFVENFFSQSSSSSIPESTVRTAFEQYAKENGGNTGLITAGTIQKVDPDVTLSSLAQLSQKEIIKNAKTINGKLMTNGLNIGKYYNQLYLSMITLSGEIYTAAGYDASASVNQQTSAYQGYISSYNSLDKNKLTAPSAYDYQLTVNKKSKDESLSISKIVLKNENGSVKLVSNKSTFSTKQGKLSHVVLSGVNYTGFIGSDSMLVTSTDNTKVSLIKDKTNTKLKKVKIGQ